MIEPNHLNVSRIRQLIENGFRALKAPKGHRQAVLVIGDTGVGKSTIISLLAGFKLTVKHNGLNTVIDSGDNKTSLKIGHDKFSETSVPTKVVIGDMDFFDCSGFRDNRGDQFEISNSFFLQRLFYLYDKVKIFLIIDEHYISEARLDKLPKLIHSLGESFGTLKQIQDGVVLLINKGKINRELSDYTKELERLTTLKGQKPLFTEDEKYFLKFLIENNRLVLFKQPDDSNVNKQLNISGEYLLKHIKNASFVKSKKIKNIISESAKLSIRDFADELLKQGENRFEGLINQIKTQLVKITVTSSSEQLSKSLGSLDKFLKEIKELEDSLIPEYLKNQLSGLIEGQFGKDITAIIFLREIYDKSNSYFTVLKHKLISELTVFRSDLQTQLAYLKQRQEQINQLKQKHIELEEKLLAEVERKNTAQKSAEQFELAFKKKNEDLQVYKGHKQSQFLELKDALANSKQTYESKIGQKQKEINSFKSELQSLRVKFQELSFNYENKSQDYDHLSIENQSLRNEIENLSIADSKISKSSKYPEIDCPHFKNGGKCNNCIRKWKQSKKKQQSQI